MEGKKLKDMKIGIVGAGISGITVANKLADLVDSIDIVDKRNHIGGNCFDYKQDGVLTHKYGAHLFHTKNEEVFEYLSNFTKWHDYKHSVKVNIKGNLYDMPINMNTVNSFFNKNFDKPEQVEEFIKSKRLDIEPTNAEEQVLSMVGPELYEAFFKEYTIKQWNTDPKNLDKSITARIPLRYNKNEQYFDDEFQAMPKEGYTHMMKNMLDKSNVTVKLNEKVDAEYFKDKDLVIWTGKIDEFYKYSEGKLDYRSLKFEFKTIDKEYYQDYAVVNFTQKEPYTRILEMKHATGQKCDNTVIVKEFPADSGESYYPVLNDKNKSLLQQYTSKDSGNTELLGRLGNYKYINMDVSVAEALDLSNRIIEEYK